LKDSAPITVIGPNGTLELKEGMIVAKRHIHMTVADAQNF
jgi:putative phosphotransacetylase